MNMSNMNDSGYAYQEDIGNLLLNGNEYKA